MLRPGRIGRRRFRGARRRKRPLRRGVRGAQRAAEGRLRRFRGATILAIAITGFLLYFLAPGEAGLAQTPGLQATEQSTTDAEAQSESAARREADGAEDVLPAAADEARETVRSLWRNFIALLPKILVAIGALVLAWGVARGLRAILRASLRHWERAEAFSTLIGIAIWILAIAIAVSILAGDMRALVGSLGLIGLALSWALQAPIESFTGWLLNSFRGYYKIGDRIAVGEVSGDVYRVDFLNTTVWEIGTPARDGYVHAEQPTGRLITFPNSEILSGSIVNFTRDFPWVWDELEIGIANESDLAYAAEVVRATAVSVVGEYMKSPALEYERILRLAGLERSIAQEPQVFISTNDWSTQIAVRYLVGARERRVWKSRLLTAENLEIAKPEHRGRILPVYPRRQIQWIGAEGAPETGTAKEPGA